MTDITTIIKQSATLRELMDFEGAAGLISGALHQFPSTESLMMEHAWIEHQQGHWETAIRRWEAVLAVRPDHLQAACCRLAALTQARRADEAEVAVAELEGRFPGRIEVLVAKAWIAHDSANWPAAADRWQKVVAIDPANISAMCCLITALAQSERFEAAMAAAEQAVACAPERPDVVQARNFAIDRYISASRAHAWNAQVEGNWQTAIAGWRIVTARAPDDLSAICCLVSTLTQARNFDDAEMVGAEAIKRFPAAAELLHTLAWIPHTRNDWGLASERWRSVTQIDSKSAPAFACLATALRGLNRFDEAEIACRQAIALDPTTLLFQIDFASLAGARGDESEAKQRWGELRARHADDPGALGTIGFHEMQQQFRSLDAQFTPVTGEMEVIVDDHEAHLRRLFISMESLGDNCEFGTVQRKFGAEPLGLLRFASVSVPDLTSALIDRFCTMGTSDSLRLEVISTGEYIIHDAYGIVMHSFVHEREISHDIFLDQIRRRVTFLRSKLITDLEEANKLFVYKARAGMSVEDALMLFRATRTYGPARLLCVLLADRAHPPGHVEIMDDGLFIGYISKFAEEEGFVDARFDEWLAISERCAHLQHGVASKHPAKSAWATPDRRSEPVVEPGANLSNLMLCFEALGDGCEFGGVQRHFGAEPLGLFRFSGIDTNHLVEALNSDLNGIGDEEFTQLVTGDGGEYFTRDIRYHMNAHTFLFADEVDYQTIRTKLCRKISFLARKMQEDLSEGGKIFVHRLHDRTIDQIDLMALYHAIRRYGTGVLLCVGLPDGKAPVGRVEVVADGLMVARIVNAVSTNPPGQPDHDFATWVSVCRQARGLLGKSPLA